MVDLQGESEEEGVAGAEGHRDGPLRSVGNFLWASVLFFNLFLFCMCALR